MWSSWHRGGSPDGTLRDELFLHTENGAGNTPCADGPGDQICRWEFPKINDDTSHGCIKHFPPRSRPSSGESAHTDAEVTPSRRTQTLRSRRVGEDGQPPDAESAEGSAAHKTTARPDLSGRAVVVVL
jgi:hypothetical protein